MKRIISITSVLTLLIFLFISCDSVKEKDTSHHDGMHEEAVKPTSSTGNFGAEITTDNALPAAQLQEMLEGNDNVKVKLQGNIDAVCQMTGCWMDVDMGNGNTVHVTFKDDAFLMPKDAAGKTAVIEGVGSYEEIPVSMLKHLAEDAGKSQEEIDAITEPKKEYTFVASGVIIQ